MTFWRIVIRSPAGGLAGNPCRGCDDVICAVTERTAIPLARRRLAAILLRLIKLFKAGVFDGVVDGLRQGELR